MYHHEQMLVCHPACRIVVQAAIESGDGLAFIEDMKKVFLNGRTSEIRYQRFGSLTPTVARVVGVGGRGGFYAYCAYAVTCCRLADSSSAASFFAPRGGAFNASRRAWRSSTSTSGSTLATDLANRLRAVASSMCSLSE